MNHHGGEQCGIVALTVLTTLALHVFVGLLPYRILLGSTWGPKSMLRQPLCKEYTSAGARTVPARMSRRRREHEVRKTIP